MDKQNTSQNEQKNIEKQSKKLANFILCFRSIIILTDDFLHESSNIITCLKMEEFDQNEKIKWDTFSASFIDFRNNIKDAKRSIISLEKQMEKIKKLSKND